MDSSEVSTTSPAESRAAPSAVSSETPPPARTKEFRCAKCPKSFTRAEHLHRHALNHEETKGTACQRCSAVFKRSDLLERHMARHKEKDAEAGGDGLGKLLTRKRLWRDSTGAIVSKRRPEHEKERKRSAPSDVDSSPARTIISRHDQLQTHLESNYVMPLTPQNPTPRSPSRALEPVSSGSDVGDSFVLGSRTLPSIESAQPTVVDDQWSMPNPIDEMPFEDAGFDSYEFLCNASWGALPSRADVASSFDDIFALDTASSFNTAFTTASYYSWLFGNEPGGEPATEPLSNIAHYSSIESMRSGIQGQSLSSSGHSDYRDARFQPPPPRTNAIAEKSHQRKQSTHILPPISHEFGSSSGTELPSLSSFGWALGAESNRNYPLREVHDDGMPESTISSHNQNPCPGPPSHDRYVLTPTDSKSSQDLYRAIPRSTQPRRLPIIDELARENILRFVDQARPKTPEGYDILRDHPLLSPSTLQHFSDLFFRRFNTTYPLLHQPTFIPSLVDPLLLVAILQLGASYSTKDDHHFAICIHSTMRSQIFGHIEFHTRPSLWMLQTILLVECFGKSRAGQLEHDMSHLFHGLLINLIRRSDCQSARSQEQMESFDLESQWRAEVDAEQRRRLALLCFMWDAQYAVLFSQSLSMNAAELRLSLPWDPALWGASTAEEWHSINLAHRPPPSFLCTLKAYINPDSGARPPSLNGLSRVLMLHGLMAVAWDLHRRDLTSLGTAISGIDESWHSRIARSYEAWRVDFEAYSRDVLLSLEDHSAEKAEFQRFNTASLAIYHTAHIALDVDIIDLQIYAGATHIIGRPVSKRDRERTAQNMEQWAKIPSIAAAQAASHAAFLLRDGIRKLHSWDAGDVFHYPWCLYLATLTCWAFQRASSVSIGNGYGANDGVQSGNDDDADWDSKAEMNALVSAMTRSKLDELWKVAGKYRTGDLPRVVAKQLGTVRWAVIQEGMIVLRGLLQRRNIR